MIKKIVMAAMACLALAYGADYAVFRLRGRPAGTVAVRRYYAILEKANRVEYVFDKEESGLYADPVSAAGLASLLVLEPPRRAAGG